MDPLILRHLACPILPKKFMSKPEPGGLSTTGALRVILKYLIIMKLRLVLHFAFYKATLQQTVHTIMQFKKSICSTIHSMSSKQESTVSGNFKTWFNSCP